MIHLIDSCFVGVVLVCGSLKNDGKVWDLGVLGGEFF